MWETQEQMSVLEEWRALAVPGVHLRIRSLIHLRKGGGRTCRRKTQLP